MKLILVFIIIAITLGLVVDKCIKDYRIAKIIAAKDNEKFAKYPMPDAFEIIEKNRKEEQDKRVVELLKGLDKQDLKILKIILIALELRNMKTGYLRDKYLTIDDERLKLKEIKK